MKNLLLILGIVLICSCNKEDNNRQAQRQLALFIENFDLGGNDGKVSDLSALTFASELENIRSKLTELASIDTSRLSFEEKIDWRFANSILKGDEIRRSSHESWKMDPRIYMDFRALDNTLGKPGSLSEKIAALEARLKILPTQLKNGQSQLKFYVPRFQELGVFMAENTRGLFTTDLPNFAAQHKGTQNLVPLIDKANQALAEYIVFLKNELPLKPEGNFAMGTETYNRMLKEQFMLDYTDDTLWAFGKQKFNETVSELEVLAKEIDATKTWQELAIEIKSEHPEPDNMIAAHQMWVDSSKSHILSHNLIPIPWKERVKVVPRVEYLRKTSYYGNFSRARGKDADSIFTAQWMINPFENQWDEKTKQEYLVEHDWGVIIVTAPHEAYGGHHVQGLYQLHNPRKLRRENGLSLFSEGWGLYNEQLMSETGFFPNKRIHLRQLQLRLWRNARVIYDVGMHTGRLHYEEAISLMTDKVGFLRWAAQLEIDSSAARPGYFIGYYIGMTEILKMRALYREKMGAEFTLSEFHKKLLEIGNMPPKLMQESLFKNQ